MRKERTMSARFDRVLGKLAAVAMAVGVVTWAGDADAAFKIQLDNPSTAPVEATIADGDLDGLIPFGPGVGNFTVNAGVGISKPQLGSALKPRLDLSSYDSSTRAG